MCLNECASGNTRESELSKHLSPRSVRSKMRTAHGAEMFDIFARVHAVRYHATRPASVNEAVLLYVP